MAINPKLKYPAQTITNDAAYPYGKARNVVTGGDGTGTPWEQDLANDILGFQQALLTAATLTPSGTPDSASVSQYLQALTYLIKHTTFDAGARVQGSPLSLAQYPTLDTVTVKRIQPLLPVGAIDGYRAQANGATADAHWYFNHAVLGWTQHKAYSPSPDRSYIVFPVSQLIDQATLTELRVLVRGRAYTALPSASYMPTVIAYRTSHEGIDPFQLSSAAADSSLTLAAFTGMHEIVCPLSTPLVIDSTTSPRNIWVTVNGVDVNAFQLDAFDIMRITATFNVSKLTPG